jgi:methionyl-tRNA formyltransferase
MAPLRIIFAGSGEFGIPSLTGLIESGHDIVHVVTQPDRPAGRGRSLSPTPIARFAAARRLAVTATGDINQEALPAADVMVVIAFGQKIGESIVHKPRLGSVNLHASLLPKWRGAAPINWAIIRGEQVTGNSVIRLANRMDVGAVLGQSRISIGELETAGEVHDRLAMDGAPLLVKVLEDLASGRAVERPQDEALATAAPKLSRESARIDFTRPAAAIASQIRGMYPWPGCRVRLLDSAMAEVGKVTLCRARAVDKSESNPGCIDANARIGAGDGAVEVIEVQPEGGRPMPLSAYRNGHHWSAGMTLESPM